MTDVSFVRVLFALSFCIYLCEGLTFYVKSGEDLNTIASEALKGNFSFDIVFEDDIDATGVAFPLGYDPIAKECTSYSGVLEGNNHTINNAVTTTGTRSGIFCGMNNSVVKNIIISESCSFAGSISAGLVDEVVGNITVKNVINKAPIAAASYGSGLVGYIAYIKSPISVVIEDCVNYGAVSVNSEYSYGYCGGILGHVWSNTNIEIRIERCINYGNISRTQLLWTELYAGGIAGYFQTSQKMVLLVKDCENNGDIISIMPRTARFFVSGIIGSVVQMEPKVEIVNNVNNGNINTDCLSGGEQRVYSGGIVGEILAFKGGRIIIDGNINNGFLRTSGRNSSAGGLIGISVFEESDLVLTNNINKGDTTSSYSFEDNVGFINGGLVGNLTCKKSDLLLSNNTNFGQVSVKVANDHPSNVIYLGGGIGVISQIIFNHHVRLQMESMINEGNVCSAPLTSESFAGGLIGYLMAEGEHVLMNCENRGDVTSQSYAGGLIGKSLIENINISNSINAGGVFGNIAYGISSVFNTASNVVSLGRIDCSTSAFLISGNISGSSSTVYGLHGNCEKCEDDSGTFMFNREADGFYYTQNGKRIDLLLDKNVIDFGYDRFWTPQLKLYEQGLCVIVVEGNVMNMTKGVKCGTSLGAIDELSAYMDNAEYMIDDLLNETKVVTGRSEVVLLSHISINSFSKLSCVELDISPTQPGFINKADALSEICNLTGIEKENLSIVYVADTEGMIFQIILCGEIEDLEKIIDAIENYCQDSDPVSHFPENP